MNDKEMNVRSGDKKYVSPAVEQYQFTPEGCIMAASFLPALIEEQAIEGYAAGDVADDFWV